LPDSAVLALVQNAAVLLAMALAWHMLPDACFTRPTPARQAALGALTGAMAVGVMLASWQFAPGIFFDARSVLLAVSGLFLGPLATAIAMATAAAFRLWQGGAAAATGVCVILASGLIGVAWGRMRRRPLHEIGLGELLLLGLAVHATMLALLFTLPGETALRVVGEVALPVLVIFPAATALLGSLLAAWLRRARTAEALRESEERLRLALRASNQGSFDIDLRTGEATVSEEYARMLGYDPATFHDSHAQWIERMHPDDREGALATYRDYMAGRLPEYRGEFRLRTRAGDWIWILSVGRIVARDGEGRPLRVMGTHTDITVRRKAEESVREAQAEASRLLAISDTSRLALLSVVEDLRSAEDRLGRSEAFYRGLFENMHEGFAFCRMLRESGAPADFAYLRVNEAFERMLGILGTEGKRASDAVLDIRRANPELADAYGRVVDTGVPETLEFHLGRLERWFLVSVYRPERDHFVSAFVDITERKLAELEVNRQLAELRRWYDATLDREDRLRELKGEVNALRRRLGEAPRYASVEDEPAPAAQTVEA
jgi:PAS domain S-box-containing protein